MKMPDGIITIMARLCWQVVAQIRKGKPEAPGATGRSKENGWFPVTPAD